MGKKSVGSIDTIDGKAVISNHPLPAQYGDQLLILDHGQGCYLHDGAGKSYLDMGSGIAVNALGYGRSDLADIASEQMRKLVHVSNLFATGPQLELAGLILDSSLPGADRAGFEAVHFGNSGTEANESAIKYARLYASSKFKEQEKNREQDRKRKGKRDQIIAFSGGFHGRTLGSLSLTANPAYREPFEPLVPGCRFLPYNDSSTLKEAFKKEGESLAAVIVEPVQGEGGLTVASREFTQTLNELCRNNDTLLIVDEVQSGLGRCGALFASTLVGLEPDIISLSKPLAGGLPLSATIIPEKINRLLLPGHHATTFGGGPVTCAVALKIWKTIDQPDFLDSVRQKGDLLTSLLNDGPGSLGLEYDLHGLGLLQGISFREKNRDSAWCLDILSRCRENGLIVLKSGKNVIRLAPPLIISKTELVEGIDILTKTLRSAL